MKSRVKGFQEWDQDKKDACHALLNQGIFYPLFLGRQREIYKLFHTMKPKTEAACLLSRKMGKSFTALLLAIEACTRKSGTICRHIFPTQKMSRDVVLPMLNELTAILPSNLMPSSVNRSEGTIRFANGSMICLGGVNPEAVENNRGSICELLILDEFGFADADWDALKYALYSVLYPQLTLSRDGKILFITTPSADPTHPFMTEILPPIISNKQYLTYNVYDSPFLNQEDIDAIIKRYGGVNSPDFRREYLCECFPDSSKVVCPEFSKEKHVIETVEAKPEWLTYMGVDLGLVDNSAFISAYWDHNRNKLVVVDEYFTRGKSLAQLAEVFTTQQDRLVPYMFDSDHIKSTVDVFEIAAFSLRKDHGLRFVRPIKHQVEDSIALLRKWLAEDKIEILPSCVNLVRELAFTEWDSRKTVNKDLARNNTGHGDGLMALCYLCWSVNTRYRPGFASTHQLADILGGY